MCEGIERFDFFTGCHELTSEDGIREETDVKLDGELHWFCLFQIERREEDKDILIFVVEEEQGQREQREVKGM